MLSVSKSGGEEESLSSSVSLENIIFRWPGQNKPVLDIPSFTVQKGEHVFIAGPSGSGKSTLLGLIAGILTPSTGSVRVNNICLNELSGAERDTFRGDHIGFIFQQFNLIPYLSVLENVLIPCRFSSLRYKKAQEHSESIMQMAETLLKRLDLSPALWHQKAHKLSVGQQQRVAAARALIGTPSILIADEPTSSLDTDRRRDFLHLLLKECTQTQSTLLFVSHDQSIMEDFSRIVHLTELNQQAKEI